MLKCELFTIDEMIKHFTLQHVTTSAAVFNSEKLLWVNEQWIQSEDKMPDLELAKHLEPVLVQEKVLPDNHNKTLDDIAKVIPPLRQRAKTLIEMAHGAEFYLKDEVTFDEKAKAKFLTPEVKPLFDKLVAGLETMEEPLDQVVIEILFKKTVEEAGLKLGKLAQPVRVALTGKTASPGIYDVVLLLGKQRTLERLKNAL